MCEIPYKQYIAQGWECPKCGAVYSPSCVMCLNCSGKPKVYTSMTSTN